MNFPDWLADTVIYQIFPASFQDSNGDGIGDLNGITMRLDHIQKLGAETIWLSPIFPSPFRDAGYDVTDYRAIAPRYGTMEDFEGLVRAVHDRGMKILLDFVPGHTSDEHPWFRASRKHERNAYSDRYIWTKTTFRLSDQGPGQFVMGHGNRDGNYLANFFYFQPALNYGFADPHPDKPWQMPCDHPSVKALRAEIASLLRYWLDKGVDGFRVDMAGSLVKGTDPAKVRAAMIAFWANIRRWWDRDYPHAALISEWSDPSAAVETGFHADFMIHFNEASYMNLFRAESDYTIFEGKGRSYFNPKGGGETQSFFKELLGHLAYMGNRGLIALPTGNHDLPRYSSGRSEAELKTIVTFLFTLPAIPTIYYGDEIGLRAPTDLPSKEGAYRRTSARTPMQWDEAKHGCGFSTADPSCFYLPIENAADRPTVKNHETRTDSLLQHMRRVLDLRVSHPALGTRGAFKQLNSPTAPYPVVFKREHEGRCYIIAVNPLQKVATAQIEESIGLIETLLGEGTLREEIGYTSLTLGPVSSFIGRIR